MDNDQNLELIQCGGHMLAPWSLVCVHLLSGETRSWVPMESDFAEVDFDWGCAECVHQLAEAEKADRLGLTPQDVADDWRAVCIHCVRQLRQKYDPNYKEE